MPKVTWKARSIWATVPETLTLRRAAFASVTSRPCAAANPVITAMSSGEAPYLAANQRPDLRQSEFAQDHSILLPIYAQMTEDDQVRVADALRTELMR